jgi:hypothetical protein
MQHDVSSLAQLVKGTVRPQHLPHSKAQQCADINLHAESGRGRTTPSIDHSVRGFRVHRFILLIHSAQTVAKVSEAVTASSYR